MGRLFGNPMESIVSDWLSLPDLTHHPRMSKIVETFYDEFQTVALVMEHDWHKSFVSLKRLDEKAIMDNLADLFDECCEVFGGGINAAGAFMVILNDNNVWYFINNNSAEHLKKWESRKTLLGIYYDVLGGDDTFSWQKMIGVFVAVMKGDWYNVILDDVEVVANLWDEFGAEAMPALSELLLNRHSGDEAASALAHGIDSETIRAFSAGGVE